MEESNLKQTIETLKTRGWNSNQVNNVLETLATVKPGELSGNINSLFILFSLIPATDTGESIDHLNAFSTTADYLNFIHFLRVLDESLKN